eukprot:8912599-Pyramimonas_sp.AAC.1
MQTGVLHVSNEQAHDPDILGNRSTSKEYRRQLILCRRKTEWNVPSTYPASRSSRAVAALSASFPNIKYLRSAMRRADNPQHYDCQFRPRSMSASDPLGHSSENLKNMVATSGVQEFVEQVSLQDLKCTCQCLHRVSCSAHVRCMDDVPNCL